MNDRQPILRHTGPAGRIAASALLATLLLTAVLPPATARADSRSGKNPGLAFLMSAILPGAGEVSMGYHRGYGLMALDILGWIGVKKYHDKGTQTREDYIAYANVHWSEDKLDDAFFDNPPFQSGAGIEYFPNVRRREDLSLWVSKEEDFREYYENAGK